MYSRRQVVFGAVFSVVLLNDPARALLSLGDRANAAQASSTWRDELRRLIGDRKPLLGRVALRVPKVADHGNVVPFEIAVDSPMTPADHVTAIHLLATGNTDAVIVMSVKLTPRSGEAKIRGRMRLERSQQVAAFAEMSDGKVYEGTRNVEVPVMPFPPDPIAAAVPRESGAPPTDPNPQGPELEALLTIPDRASRGDIVLLELMLPHAMRPAASDSLPARPLLHVETAFAGERVFSGQLYAGFAANPYLAIPLRAEASGAIAISWREPDGQSWTRTGTLSVR